MTVTVGSTDRPKDLASAIFVALTSAFFANDGSAVSFELRGKNSTQDDPFDEHVRKVLQHRLPKSLRVLASNMPLVSPDIVVARPGEDSTLKQGGTQLDPRRLLALEVKKLNTKANGRVGRSSSLDYNSTPPCEKVNVFTSRGTRLSIPAFYLFAALTNDAATTRVYSLALVCGGVLNRDTELYNAATSVREKSIGLGSFGDGLNRQRPMFVFTNPLGWDWLNEQPTLIHERSDLADEQSIHRARKLVRTDQDATEHEFWCYRLDSGDSTEELPTAFDPFPSEAARHRRTSQRGRFRLNL